MRKQNVTYYIYALQEVKTTEYRYIGQTVNMQKRLIAHLATDSISLKIWKDSVYKRGSRIEMIEIDTCTYDDVDFTEMYYIKKYTLEGHRLLNTAYSPSYVLGL